MKQNRNLFYLFVLEGSVNLKVIGITGGIGSGKSTVSRIIYDLGARIIDADIITRQVTRKGEKAYNEIVEKFGPEVVKSDGSLDRSRLAQIVFNDERKRMMLNEITHKYVAEEIYNKLERMREVDKPEIVVLDVPLPVEKGFLDVVDEVWVVVADEEKRIKRVMERSGLTREEVVERIRAQMSNEDYKRIADVVIENNGSIEELEQKVVKLFIQRKTG